MGLVENVSLSTHQLINDEQILQALEFFGWATAPVYRADVVSFPNATNNCEIRLSGGNGGFVIISVVASLQANAENYENGQFSFFPEAKTRMIQWIEQYSNFDLFNMTNNVNDLNF